jgi:GntR family transcriptional regulator
MTTRTGSPCPSPPEAAPTVADPLTHRFATEPAQSDKWPSPAGARRYDANVTSTNATVEIDHASPVPLYEQVAAAIRRAIAEGEAQAGERLPPAKDLASVLGVNANTVFRALRALREEGLVEFRRGRGVSVTGIAPQRSVVIAKARELVDVARRYGYRADELAEIIDLVS